MNSTRLRISSRSALFAHHHFNGVPMKRRTPPTASNNTPPTTTAITCRKNLPHHEFGSKASFKPVIASIKLLSPGCRSYFFLDSRFFEIALVFVRLDDVARCIEYPNHSMMRSAAMLGVPDCVADCVWF